MALGHSAINPLLFIVFSTRAVRAAFLQLRQRVLARCCLRGRQGRGRGRGQAASHRPWVVTPEPSTASGDGGDRKSKFVVSRCLSCRRKRLAGTAHIKSAQRVVVFSSQPTHHHHHHHHHHQCYPPHQQQQQQQQPQQSTSQHAATGFRATWSVDGIPHDSRYSLVTARSRYATTQSAPSGVQRGHRVDSSSAGFPY